MSLLALGHNCFTTCEASRPNSLVASRMHYLLAWYAYCKPSNTTCGQHSEAFSAAQGLWSVVKSKTTFFRPSLIVSQATLPAVSTCFACAKQGRKDEFQQKQGQKAQKVEYWHPTRSCTPGNLAFSRIKRNKSHSPGFLNSRNSVILLCFH